MLAASSHIHTSSGIILRTSIELWLHPKKNEWFWNLESQFHWAPVFPKKIEISWLNMDYNGEDYMELNFEVLVDIYKDCWIVC